MFLATTDQPLAWMTAEACRCADRREDPGRVRELGGQDYLLGVARHVQYIPTRDHDDGQSDP